MEALRIAIIGGGASGTILAINLLQNLQQPAHIYLVEKEKHKLFRGIAYSSSLEYEPLNVPVGKMSAFSGQPDDFYDWLTENTPWWNEITRNSFVSRRWFGDYLESRIKQAIEQKPAGISFQAVISTVQSVLAHGASYILNLEDGTSVQADVLVLATGNEAPGEVLSEEAKQVLGNKYISKPWDTDVQSQVAKEDDVLIIGTGLTMVDHVLSLHKRGQSGKITAISRNGLLPKTHGISVPYKLTKDISDADFYRFYENLYAEIENAGRQNINWISVLDAIRDITPAIWKKFNVESKRIFLERHRIKWEIHRHRIPPASVEEIHKMIAAGKLEILQGSITGVEKHGTHFRVQYRHSFSWSIEKAKAHRLINCTGPCSDYSKSGSPLYKQLLAMGWLCKDDLNLGIVTGARGEVIQRNGEYLPRVFAMGPVRKASEWESTAIREIRLQAEALSKLIAGDVDKRIRVRVVARQ